MLCPFVVESLHYQFVDLGSSKANIRSSTSVLRASLPQLRPLELIAFVYLTKADKAKQAVEYSVFIRISNI